MKLRIVCKTHRCPVEGDTVLNDGIRKIVFKCKQCELEGIPTSVCTAVYDEE